MYGNILGASNTYTDYNTGWALVGHETSLWSELFIRFPASGKRRARSQEQTDTMSLSEFTTHTHTCIQRSIVCLFQWLLLRRLMFLSLTANNKELNVSATEETDEKEFGTYPQGIFKVQLCLCVCTCVPGGVVRVMSLIFRSYNIVPVSNDGKHNEVPLIFLWYSCTCVRLCHSCLRWISWKDPSKNTKKWWDDRLSYVYLTKNKQEIHFIIIIIFHYITH